MHPYEIFNTAYDKLMQAHRSTQDVMLTAEEADILSTVIYKSNADEWASITWGDEYDEDHGDDEYDEGGGSLPSPPSPPFDPSGGTILTMPEDVETPVGGILADMQTWGGAALPIPSPITSPIIGLLTDDSSVRALAEAIVSDVDREIKRRSESATGFVYVDRQELVDCRDAMQAVTTKDEFVEALRKMVVLRAEIVVRQHPKQ